MAEGQLKDGKKTSEFLLTVVIIIAGILLIVYSKASQSIAVADLAKSITPGAIADIAKMIRDNTDEYLGAAMILISAITYMIKRCVLKYFEIKHVIEIAEREAESAEETKK